MGPVTEIIGWDIGGVHTKAVWLRDGDLGQARSASQAFEIWRADSELPDVLGRVYRSLGAVQPDAMAVTMTAELADCFESKRQGVLFVLDALRRTFPHTPIYLLSLDREFERLEAALEHPSRFAAANWLASALFVAHYEPDCLLIDVGSTTTDLIPIREGQVAAEGRTDLERLATGELVYTGVLYTNPNTLVQQAPIRGRACSVAAEKFSQMADVYLLLGLLEPGDYTAPTADGGPKTVLGAQRRLARLVCADAETLSAAEIQHLAWYLYEKQLQRVVEAAAQVCSRYPGAAWPLAAVGSGRFLAAEVSRRLGLPLAEWTIPAAALEVLPCLGVAALLHWQMEQGTA